MMGQKRFHVCWGSEMCAQVLQQVKKEQCMQKPEWL